MVNEQSSALTSIKQQTLRIATRKSPLALQQANFIRSLILQHHPELTIELLPLITSGDQFNKNKPERIANKGLFVKELEEALLDRRADLAVHSIKDLPMTLPDGLGLVAICRRDSPFDALISHHEQTLDTLAPRARIGTSSLRRQAQLLALRPDLRILPLRGNINTRLARLDAHDFDAIVLAAAGLARLNITTHSQHILHESIMLPACGQGALGIECRQDDEVILPFMAKLNHPETALCVSTERHVNHLLGGNCHTPLAVYCVLQNSQLLLQAKLATADGATVITDSQRGKAADTIRLAEACAQNLLRQGAAGILNPSTHHD